MSRKIPKNKYSSKILNILAEKPAIALSEFNEKFTCQPATLTSIKEQKKDYALTRSMKNLIESGCIKILQSDNKSYLKLTKKGKNKLNCIKLKSSEALVPTAWDGSWRIIILDIPEERKSEREALRYLLKKADFICIKNTVWISPYPYEHLFTNIKRDLGLGTELMIIVTDKLDEETKLTFIESSKR